MMEKEFFLMDEITNSHIDSHVIKKSSSYYKNVQSYHKSEQELEQKRKAQLNKKRIIKWLMQKDHAKKDHIDYGQRIKIIKSIVKEGHKMIGKDLYAAAAMYSNLQPLYKDLPDPLKEKMYSQILPFYKELETRLKPKTEDENQTAPLV